MKDGPGHCAGCTLIHHCIFSQHKDWAGPAKDQKVPRLDPATLAKEDARPDITDPPADPKQHLAFLLAGTIGFFSIYQQAAEALGMED